MDAGSTFITDPQAAHLVQPRDRSLHHPTQHAQTTVLIRAHTSKEDRVLFEMADHMIRGEELRNLDHAYDQSRSVDQYCAVLRRRQTITEDLARRQRHGAS